MNSWTTANGVAVEKALMEWSASLGQLAKKED